MSKRNKSNNQQQPAAKPVEPELPVQESQPEEQPSRDDINPTPTLFEPSTPTTAESDEPVEVAKDLEETAPEALTEIEAPKSALIQKDHTAYSDEFIREFADMFSERDRREFGEIIRQRNDLHAGWTNEECWTWFLTDESPEPTESGLWVNDPSRATRSFREWTAAELAAALRGEIPLPPDADREEAGVRLRFLIHAITADLEVFEWAVADLVQFALFADQPRRSESGVLLASDARDKKKASAWTEDELRAFILGEIPGTDKAPDDVLYDTAVYKLGANIRWTPEQVRQFVIDGTLPPVSKFGVLVDDVYRNNLPVQQWTFLEVVSAIRGDINVPSDIDVTSEYLRREGMSAAAGSSLKENLLKLEKVSVPMAIEFVENALKQYAEVMNPKAAITDAKGASTQTGFFRTLQKTLKLSGQDFADGWTQILTFVAENREGLFHESRAYRFLESMQISPAENRQFQALMDLLMHTCKPADRRQANQRVNFARLATVLSNDAVMQRLIAYYES